MIKKLFTVLLTCAICTATFGQQDTDWIPVGPEGGSISRLYELENYIFALHSVYDFYRSSDDGKNWEAVKLPKPEGFNLIRIDHDRHNLVALFDDYYSDEIRVFLSNNGDEWRELRHWPFSTGQDAALLTFKFQQGIMAIKYNAALFYSDDLGQSWKPAPHPYGLNSNERNIYIYNDHIFVGGAGTMGIYSIIDTSWTAGRLNNSGYQIRYIYQFDSTIIAATSDSDNLQYRSTDFGMSWQKISIPIDNDYAYFSFDPVLYQDTLYLMGTYSPDGGHSWTSICPTAYDNGVLDCTNMIVRDNRILTGHYWGVLISKDRGQTYEFSNKGIFSNTVFNLALYNDTLYTYLRGMLRSPADQNNWQPWDILTPSPAAPLQLITFQDSLFYMRSDVVYRFSEASRQWLEKGKYNTFFEWIATSDYVMIAKEQLQDDFFQAIDHGDKWNKIQLPTTLYNSLNQGGLIQAGIGDSLHYFQTRGGDLVQSHNLKDDWKVIPPPPDGLHIPIINGQKLRVVGDQLVFINDNRLYAYDPDTQSWRIGAQHPIYTGRILYFDKVENYLLLFIQEQGFFLSEDLGDHWIPFSDEGEFGGVYDVIDKDGTIYAADRYGGSVWKRDLAKLKLSSLRGYVFWDRNNNGLKDPEDQGLPGIFLSYGGHDDYAITDSTGRYYTAFDGANPDTLRVLLNNLPYEVSITPSYAVPDAEHTQMNFAVYLEPDRTDWAISLHTQSPPRAGFNNRFFLHYRNDGTTETSGSLSFMIDPKLGYQWAVPAPSLVNNDTLIWNLNTLHLWEKGTIEVRFTPPADLPLLTAFQARATITPFGAEDVDLQNNEVSWSSLLLSSFDPNDKLVDRDVLETGNQRAEQELIYTIRFQNVGNYQADKVVIRDTLDQKLEIESLRVLAASHPYTLEVEKSGAVTFIFDRINLPYADEDETGSNGYIQYAVRALPDLLPEDSITNKAGIYFDFNAPIITNTTVTKIAYAVGIFSIPVESYPLTVFPNPTRDLLQVELPAEIREQGTLQLYNQFGQCLLSRELGSHRFSVDTSDLSSGAYWILISSKGKVAYAQFMVQK
ncbi:MAG: T9SS type A sorting domain-containing protein [Saprospiraceae bacterium]|nr:T9SS type A sorting domain-containing protein [Lewinella sp.]